MTTHDPQTVKPPTQIAGVVGIASVPVTMHAPASVDWRAVAGLPPFQMFAAERMRNISGKDSMDHALDYVRAMGGGMDLMEQYSAWHEAKGFWPNETPLGEAKLVEAR